MYENDDYTELRYDDTVPAGHIALCYLPVMLIVVGFLITSIFRPELTGTTCCCGGGVYLSKESHKRIILFGPPGAGKRTILAEAHSRGLSTVDLVTQGRNYRQRWAAFQRLLANPVEGIELINAADLRVEDFPDDVEVVLILPPVEAYKRRYEECCEMRPEERAHNEMIIYQQISGIAGQFSRVIRGDKSPEKALDQILAPYNWEESLSDDSDAQLDPVDLERGGGGDGESHYATNPLAQMDHSLLDASEENSREREKAREKDKQTVAL